MGAGRARVVIYSEMALSSIFSFFLPRTSFPGSGYSSFVPGTAGILQSCKNKRQNVVAANVSFYHDFYQWMHVLRQHSDACFCNIDIFNP